MIRQTREHWRQLDLEGIWQAFKKAKKTAQRPVLPL